MRSTVRQHKQRPLVDPELILRPYVLLLGGYQNGVDGVAVLLLDEALPRLRLNDADPAALDPEEGVEAVGGHGPDSDPVLDTADLEAVVPELPGEVRQGPLLQVDPEDVGLAPLQGLREGELPPLLLRRVNLQEGVVPDHLLG